MRIKRNDTHQALGKMCDTQHSGDYALKRGMTKQISHIVKPNEVMKLLWSFGRVSTWLDRTASPRILFLVYFQLE